MKEGDSGGVEEVILRVERPFRVSTYNVDNTLVEAKRRETSVFFLFDFWEDVLLRGEMNGFVFFRT